jgi:hypothetical protein
MIPELNFSMLSSEITESLLALPEADRLDLARTLIASIAAPEIVSDSIAEGVHRLEEVVEGKVGGLSEEAFRQALG